MGKFLKTFLTHLGYKDYINDDEKILPNVSFCEDNKCTHYNPLIETKVIAIFNVDTIGSVDIINSDVVSLIAGIMIDGVVQPSVVSSYNFTTTGEHTVKYILKHNTLGDETFRNCSNLKSIFIPEGIENIGYNTFRDCYSLIAVSLPSTLITISDNAFSDCYALTNITIPKNVSMIGDFAFNVCGNLISVTIKAKTPPEVGTFAFNGNDPNRKFYVPANSVSDYQNEWTDYSSEIEAINN